MLGNRQAFVHAWDFGVDEKSSQETAPSIQSRKNWIGANAQHLKYLSF